MEEEGEKMQIEREVRRCSLDSEFPVCRLPLCRCLKRKGERKDKRV
ncbi:uncharacterized protein G2W53_015311 [Senna tora]|uniref:Uncharacterized protein n=1 Tax=Senna tora TaxID=362788 RepID=A0A834WVU2_9FABA|nr:uncharacterized protein G2W53_015311 [Senna tora]